MNLLREKQKIQITRSDPKSGGHKSSQPQQKYARFQSKLEIDTGHNSQIQKLIQNPSQEDNPTKAIRERNAKMLIISSCEQRLITFTLPRDSFTLQDLLEQINVPFDHSCIIQCISRKNVNIDYVITVGIPLSPPVSRAKWIKNPKNYLLNQINTNFIQQQQQIQKSFDGFSQVEDILASAYIPNNEQNIVKPCLINVSTTISQTDPEHAFWVQVTSRNLVKDIEKEISTFLFILASGEQRLVTFKLPSGSCTVEALLNELGISIENPIWFQYVSNRGGNIDYVANVGLNPLPTESEIQEILQNAETCLMLNKTNINIPQKAHQYTTQSSVKIRESLNDTDIFYDIFPLKFMPGFYAICKECGNCSLDQMKCDICKTMFVEKPKPYSFGYKTKKIIQNAQINIERR